MMDPNLDGVRGPCWDLYEAGDIGDVDFRDTIGLPDELMQYPVFSKDFLQTQKCHMDRR